jgi:hypothetical protein
LQHITARRDAAPIAVLGQLERFLESDDRIVENLLLVVERAQLEIILRELSARSAEQLRDRLRSPA